MRQPQQIFPGQPAAELPSSHATLRAIALCFVYWSAFLLVLEPGNIGNVLSVGLTPRWGREAQRICGGGLLGATTAPLLFWLVQRIRVRGAARWRNAALHLAINAALAAGLIIVAHFMALWLLDHSASLSLTGLPGELAANELLLIFCLSVWTTLVHLAHPAEDAGAVAPRHDGARRLEVIEIRSRGRLRQVAVSDIDWIEAQGNYLALHIGDASILMRETLGRLEARLDPARFVRVHRGAVVAAGRVVEIQPSTNGDALARLRGGQSIRVSRLYRERLWGMVGKP